ncbi:MAG: cell division protein FtsZ [Bacteroidales bacterium]|nr:cell division protein FtsZ [Bacteroidales bacterium]
MEELMRFEGQIEESNILKMDSPKEQSSYIKVLGVGGAGTNAVDHMFKSGIQGVDFIVCNTDQASLDRSPVSNKIKIGEGGLGAGNTPERARIAAEEAEEEIKSYLEHNTRMLFVTAGMGGGTGTGASPVIARFAKEIKLESTDEQILVVGVVTLPLSFEGRKRKTQAEEGIKKLKEEVDAIITINTDKLREYGNFTMSRAFAMADDILLTAARGISEMMTGTGHVHVDFRDVQSVMQNSGVALMGVGIAEGENRAIEAIQSATTSKLLNDNDISATKNILLYFLSSEENEIRMEEIDTITTYLETITNDDVDYIWGMGIDNSLGDKLSVTLVATGFESKRIYEPPTRDNNKEIIPLPPQTTEIPTGDSTLIRVDSPQMKVQDKTPVEDKTLPAPTQPENEGKTIIRVDNDMNRIDSSSTTSAPETSPKLTEIIQEPTVTVIDTPINTPLIPNSPISTPTFEVKNPQSEEIISSQPKVFPPMDANPNVSVEEKMERIRMIKEMLSTDAGIDRIIASSPFEIEQQNFSQANDFSNYSVNKEGAVVYGKNKALDAQVD